MAESSQKLQLARIPELVALHDATECALLRALMGESKYHADARF